MILDSGICKIYRKTNVAAPGAKPVFSPVEIHNGWYGELSFATSPGRPTPEREEVHTDARIRILQNRGIANHDLVELHDAAGNTTLYDVTRAYHGTDDDSGERITDLSLEVTKP